MAVSTDSELKMALNQVKVGGRILIEPGVYNRGISLINAVGTMANPIVIAGSDPDNPPVFTGSGEGAKLSNCAYIKLRGLIFRGFQRNGVNIDDGGVAALPSHHIILESINILDTGTGGNQDALKMSGVNSFIVRNCRFEGWGGSGIDLVGCHKGVIEGCLFKGTEGYRTANAIQIKGGSSSILVQTSFFQNAGERSINIGGKTGFRYFRPYVTDYEAKDIIVAGNRFVDGEAHIAWVTSQDTYIHHNIFYYPGEWLARILQETKNKRFKPCQNGLFEDNLIVADGRVRHFINVGPGTKPASFAFRHNAWYIAGEREKPDLPTREVNGVYEVYPYLKEIGTPRMEIGTKDPRLADIGPRAYNAWQAGKDFADLTLPMVKRGVPGAAPFWNSTRVAFCFLIMALVGAVVATGVKKIKR